MTGRALILGGNGRFGRHTAEAFWNASWQVRHYDRKTDDLMTAVKGVDVIVNGWNPLYPAWSREVPRMTRDVIAAATSVNATVILPGNVYIFGKGAGPLLDETTAHAAQNPLGRIRVDMEAAYRASGVRTIVLRAGDFIDTTGSGNWFDSIVAAKSRKGRITSPGDADAPHAWAYLPDMARAAVALAENRHTLAAFEDIPFPGYTLGIRQLAEHVARASGRAQTVVGFNWLPLFAAAPFWPMGRKLIEMRYLWSMPHSLSGEKFDDLLPGFSATDPLTAIGEAIAQFDIHPDQPMARGAGHVLAQ
jgi:nucleoside-diphosphate-sugar epimerase